MTEFAVRISRCEDGTLTLARAGRYTPDHNAVAMRRDEVNVGILSEAKDLSSMLHQLPDGLIATAGIAGLQCPAC